METICSQELTIILELLVNCVIEIHIGNGFDPDKHCRPFEGINSDIHILYTLIYNYCNNDISLLLF
jgi:hypothetical protein